MPRFSLQLILVALIWAALPLLSASQAQALDSSSTSTGSGLTPATVPSAGVETVSLKEILCAVSIPGEDTETPSSCAEMGFAQQKEGHLSTAESSGGSRVVYPASSSSASSGDASVSSQNAGQHSARSSSKAARDTFYRVQWGDTLYDLSQKFDVSIDKIKEWNGLKTNVLLEGEKLRLFPSSPEKQLSPSDSYSQSGSPARADTGTSGSTATNASSSGDRSSSNANGPDQPQTRRSTTSPPPTRGPDGSMEESSPDPAPHEGAIPYDVKESSPLYEKIEKAAATYARSGHARVVVSDDGEKHYPYGRDIPTIHTAVLHVTTVELAKGEYVNSMTIGDNQRWQVNTASAGTEGDFQQVVQIKPQECGTEGKTDMQTNLLLMTNQGRTYDLMLKSLPCENQGQGRPKPKMAQWDRTISFYYPSGRSVGPASNMTQRLERPNLRGRRPPRSVRRQGGRSQMQMRQVSDSGAAAPMPRARRQPATAPAPRARRQPATTNPGQSGRSSRFQSDRGASGASIDLRDIQTSHYEVTKDRDFPCDIDLVGDDGERVYIRLSDTPGCTSTYPLYEVKDRGNLQLTNYQVPNGNIYIKPGPVEKLALLYRQSDGDDSRVTITNTKISDSRRP